MKRKRIYKVLVFIGFVWLNTSCDNIHKFTHGHKSLAEHVREHSVDSLQYQIDARDIYAGSEKLVSVSAADSSISFYVPERISQITSYPCANCHTVSLDEMVNLEDDDKKAHWDKNIDHADASVMACTTCHSENNINSLTSINEKEIHFNESYKLCMQCHSTQYNDWIGGSHGKSLGGWVEPRIMNNCVNCHDPHNPAFESRWPARLNTIKLKEQTSN